MPSGRQTFETMDLKKLKPRPPSPMLGQGGVPEGTLHAALAASAKGPVVDWTSPWWRLLSHSDLLPYAELSLTSGPSEWVMAHYLFLFPLWPHSHCCLRLALMTASSA